MSYRTFAGSQARLTRQETVPALTSQLGVLGELAADHELLDAVNRVDVVHAVDDDPAHLLEALEAAHRGDRVALHEDVAVCEELDGLEGRAVRADDALAALDKALLVTHEAGDLDHIARHVVLEHLERLRGRDTTREQLEQVAALEDDIRVPRLAGRAHRHAALHQVQLACQAEVVERLGHCAPNGAEVRLPVLGEQEREGRLFKERLVLLLVGLGERVHLPVVNVVRVPGCACEFEEGQSNSTHACPSCVACSC